MENSHQGFKSVVSAAVRAKSVLMREAIAATTSIEDFEALLASGTLSDWPTQE